MPYNGRAVGAVRIIKTKYMNEEEIRDEARKAANRSQFMSNHVYDHKSYEDGFYEGMNQALRQPPVSGSILLKYTEYKKQQALWLQRENSKRTNRGNNTEQFCIQCYWSYLNLIGFEKQSTFEKIKTYIDKIGTYHLQTGDDFYNDGYDENVARNINKFMDEVLF